MNPKKMYLFICVSFALILAASACALQAGQAASSSTQTPPDSAATPTPTLPPEIVERFTQAVQTAQARYADLEGEPRESGLQGVAIWQDITWHELLYAQAHPEELPGSLEEKLDRYVDTLERSVEADIRWAGFEERTPDERRAVQQAVEEDTGVEAVYQTTYLWPFDRLSMVEVYNAGSYAYSVNVETDRIVEIEPRNDASISLPDPDREPEDGWEMARQVIARLAPWVALEQLSINAETPRYYRWEDRGAEMLPDGSYPYVQVQFTTDGEFVNFVNTLPGGG